MLIIVGDKILTLTYTDIIIMNTYEAELKSDTYDGIIIASGSQKRQLINCQMVGVINLLVVSCRMHFQCIMVQFIYSYYFPSPSLLKYT